MIATSEKAHEISANGAFTRQKNRFTTPFGIHEVEWLVYLMPKLGVNRTVDVTRLYQYGFFAPSGRSTFAVQVGPA